MGWTQHNPTGIFQNLSQSPGARQDPAARADIPAVPSTHRAGDRQQGTHPDTAQGKGRSRNRTQTLGTGNGTIHPAWPWADTKQGLSSDPKNKDWGIQGIWVSKGDAGGDAGSCSHTGWWRQKEGQKGLPESGSAAASSRAGQCSVTNSVIVTAISY